MLKSKGNLTVKNILVVDNDPLFCDLMRRFLQKQGHQVLTAPSGISALEILKNFKPDIIFLDLIMPNLGGEKLCRMIRDLDDLKEVFIIIITAASHSKESIHLKDLGANAWLEKTSFSVLSRYVSAVLKQINSGTPLETIRLARDDEEKGLVKELISIKSHLEVIIDSLAEGLVELDASKRVIFANPAAVSAIGRPESDLLSSDFAALFEERTSRERVRGFLESVADRQDHHPEATFHLSSGREVTLNFLSVGGSAESNLVILNDVTDRKKAERALQEYQWNLEKKVQERTAELVRAKNLLEEELARRQTMEAAIQQSKSMLRAVFDGILDPLIMVSSGLDVLMVNKATIDYCHMVAYSEILGRPLRDVILRDDAPKYMGMVTSAVVNGQAMNFEVTEDGDILRYEKIFVYPIRSDGKAKGAAIIRISDITRQKLMDRELIQREKLASLGLLVSGVVHEINNPNNFISFNIPILKNYLHGMMPIVDEHASRQKDFEMFGMPYEDFRRDLDKLLDNVEHGAHRISATIAKLRQFSRKKDKDEGGRTGVNAAIANAISICQNQINKSIKSFSVEVEPELPTLPIDSEALEQVIINLLINAVHASDKKESSLQLRAFRGGTWQNHVNIEVSDNGSGMSQETIAKLFDPFFTTKKNGQGTGLGLYITRNIVEELGGRITVESEPGKGTMFRIVLPDASMKLDRAVEETAPA